MFSNLSVGRGTENIVMQYCKFSPSDVDITIFQTDFPRGEVQEKDFDFGLSKPKIVTLRGFDQRSIFPSRSIVVLALTLYVRYPFLFLALRFIKEYREMRKQLKDFDVVYVFGNYWSSLVPRGPIVVGSPQGWEPERIGVLKALNTSIIGNGLIWRRIDYFHLFPRNSWFLERYNKKGFVLGNGSRLLSSSSETIKENNKLEFCFLGALEECKGTLTAVKAFELLRERVRDRELELHLVGSGPLLNEIEEGQGMVKHGFIGNKKELQSILSSSDCFIYPTTCDTFALVVIEALSAGTYAIVSDRLRGVYDKFEYMGVLEYCPPTAHALADQMQNFLAKSVPKKNFDIARQLILREYSWESITEKLFAEFRKLVKENS
jgi:glycosyltransferase involved in cell wall biosynthesis